MKRQAGLVLAFLVVAFRVARNLVVALDCNSNGVDDSIDIATPVMDFKISGSFQIGVFPMLQAPADFDGDGDLDLVGVGCNGRRECWVELIENDGHAQFRTRGNFPLSGTVKSVTAGDLDADGDLDLAVAMDFAVEVLWNDGAAGFTKSTKLTVGSGPAQVFARDLDGDGDLDLVTANFLFRSPAPDSVSVILNEGKGQFSVPRNFAAHKGVPVLEGSDVDKDGDVDLVVGGANQDSLVVLKNGGKADFSTMEEVQIEPGFRLASFALGDLDGDGDTDAVVTSAASPLKLLLNDGRGQLAPAGNLQSGGSAVVVKDMNGDRAPDLVIAEACPDIALFFNDGRGGFLPGPAIKAGLFIRSLGVSDWNSDGAPDLAALASFGPLQGRLVVLLQTLSTVSKDCNQNGIPDECETDCNQNGVPDDCDIASEASRDCDGNKLPDECDTDCNANGVPDACDIASGAAADCDLSGVPDSCELGLKDLDGNGILDSCEIERDPSLDCDGNGSLDSIDLKPRFALAEEEYSVSGRPQALAAADLDGDGDLDLAVSSNDSSPSGSLAHLELLANRGDGTFAAARTSSVSSGSVAGLVESFDVDGDGKMDLAIGWWEGLCRPPVVRILVNDGDFKLTRRASYAVDFGLLSLRAADLDGDQVLDLVVAGSLETFPAKGTASVLRGRGNGTFVAPDAVGRAQHAVTADVDGDGDLDIVSDSGAVLLNQGNGAFVDGKDLPSIGYRIEAGDLDGDGDLDLVLGEGVGEAFFLLNEGRGTFVRGATATSMLWGEFRIVDLDADGAPDLAMTQTFDAVAVRRNLRGGNFAAEVKYPVGEGPWALRAGDVDGDRDLDLITANVYSSSISVLRNKGDGSFSALPHFDPAGVSPSFATVDVDSDGDQDLLSVDCCSDGPQLVILENDGRGLLSAHKIRLERRPISMAPADFNGDGATDLVFLEFGAAGEDGTTISFLFNERDAGFRKGVRLAAAQGSGSSSVSPVDLDGDGDMDVVALNWGSFSIFLNPGDGTFGEARNVPTDLGQDFLLPGDLDGDGDADIVILNSIDMSLWRNQGQASFVKEAPTPLPAEPLAAVLGNLDGDGDLDLAIGIAGNAECAPENPADCGPSVSVALNSGDGTFGRLSFYLTAGSSQALVATDLDRDGDLDLVLPVLERDEAESEQSQLVILLNRGDGSFSPRRKFTAEGLVAVGDLDGNGYPDLIVYTSLGLSVIWNRTLPPPGIDADKNGILDACERAPFLRGDVDQSGSVSLTDAVSILRRLFLGGITPGCEKAADVNDDGKVDIADPIRLLGHLFLGQGPLPEPFGACGLDSTKDTLTCIRFAACQERVQMGGEPR
jgi:hypothetical protein